MLPRTRRTQQVGGFTGVQLGHKPRSTVMAESRAIAHTRQAVRANGVQVALVQREFGLAVGTNRAVLGSGRSARGAVDYAGIVPLGLFDLHQMPTVAAEAAADASATGIVLPLAVRALDEQTHRANPRIFARPGGNRDDSST